MRKTDGKILPVRISQAQLEVPSQAPGAAAFAEPSARASAAAAAAGRAGTCKTLAACKTRRKKQTARTD